MTKYRADIDGLRGLAVLAVVVFHAFPELAAGGFAGVDVFFVISGFLITSIILESLEQDSFSLAGFYARRIRRIFPALSLVLLACLAFGWIALLADEYKQLGKHVAAAAGFVSNFALWSEVGYFDNAANTKPLQHLWSLGVEEQFYLAWPVVLWLAWKRKRHLVPAVAALALLSFGLNVAQVGADPTATFYSPQTRAWELLGGSLLALYPRRRPPPGVVPGLVSSVAGLLLLCWSFLWMDREQGFPGAWAAAPVLSTVLAIFAGPAAWVNRTILSHRWLVGFGLISFPLYLWHWPLLAFFRIVAGEPPGLAQRLMAVALSIVLAWLTYRLLETPLRTGGHGPAKAWALAALLAVTGCAGYATYANDGLGFRTADKEAFLAHFENAPPGWNYSRKVDLARSWRMACGYSGYGPHGEPRAAPADSLSRPLDASCHERDPAFAKSVLLWGDSHAQTLSPGLSNHIPREWQVLQVASAGCRPEPAGGQAPSNDPCARSNRFAMDTVAKARPDVVVVAQARGHSPESMRAMSARLAALGAKKVLFVGPVPQWTTDLPRLMARALWQTKPRRTFVGLDRDVLRINDALKAVKLDGGSQFVDAIGLFCDASGCLTHTGDDMKETFTTWDNGHLTPSASDYLARNLLVEKIVSP